MDGQHATAEHDEAPRIRSVLSGRWGQAMFVSELVARLANEPADAGGEEPARDRRIAEGQLPERVDVALSCLERAGEVLVSEVPPPDPCFRGDDLRVVALVGGTSEGEIERARERIAAVAEQLAREILATHTCG